jgi:hypothetical protein
MGDVADMMVNGDICSWCSSPNSDPGGYPVICQDCFDEWSVQNPGKGEKELTRTLGLGVAD